MRNLKTQNQLKIRKDNELILLLSRSELKNNELSRVEDLFKEDLDWSYIFERSKQEGVACLLYQHLKKVPLKDFVPVETEEALKNTYYSNSLRNASIYAEIKKLLQVFNVEKIKIVILKGIFLAENIYKNIALRPMTDVDILIKKEDFAKVNEILNSLGYFSVMNYMEVLQNPFSYCITFSPKNPDNFNSFSIDVHWHILSSTWMMGFLSGRIDMERVWHQAEPVKIDAIDTFALCSEHLLIYLSLHGFSHSFDRMLLLTDIIETLTHYNGRLAQDRVREEAEIMGVENILSYSLYFAFKKLGFQSAARNKFTLSGAGFERKAMDFLINNGKINLSCLVYILTKEKFRDKLKLMARAGSLLSYLINRNFNTPA